VDTGVEVETPRENKVVAEAQPFTADQKVSEVESEKTALHGAEEEVEHESSTQQEEMQQTVDLPVEPKADDIDQVAMSSPSDEQNPTLEIDKQTGEEERVDVSTTTSLSDDEEMQQTVDLSVEPKVDDIDQVAMSSPTDEQKSTLEIEKQTGEEERVDVSTTASLSDDEKDSPLKVSSTTDDNEADEDFVEEGKSLAEGSIIQPEQETTEGVSESISQEISTAEKDSKSTNLPGEDTQQALETQIEDSVVVAEKSSEVSETNDEFMDEYEPSLLEHHIQESVDGSVNNSSPPPQEVDVSARKLDEQVIDEDEAYVDSVHIHRNTMSNSIPRQLVFLSENVEAISTF
jgi:hypothetical protein